MLLFIIYAYGHCDCYQLFLNCKPISISITIYLYNKIARCIYIAHLYQKLSLKPMLILDL